MAGRVFWLRHNTFFETTSLSGYLFISRSKSKIELTFWYLCMVVFIVLTVRDVYCAIENYLQYPTITTVQITDKLDNATIKEFNLTIQVSAYEFAYNDFIPTIGKIQPYNAYERLVEKGFIKSLITASVEEAKAAVLSENSTENREAMTPVAAKMWLHSLQNTSTKLDHIFSSFLSLTPGLKMEDTQSQFLLSMETLEKIRRVLSEMMPFRSSASLSTFKMLESFSHKSSMPSADQMLDGSEVLNKSLNALSRLLILDRSEKSEIYLRNLQSSVSNDILNFTFLVKIDSNDLEVEIYSKSFAQFLTLAQALNYHILQRMYETLDVETLLGLSAKVEYDKYLKIINSLVSNNYAEMLDHYERTTSLFLVVSGNILHMSPFFSYDITIIPEGHIESHTKNCYGGTFQQCIDQCVNVKTFESYGCSPWFLYYLNEHQPLCTTMFDSDHSDCSHNCEQQVQHSCKHLLYRIEYTRNQIQHLGSTMYEPFEPVHIEGIGNSFQISDSMRKYAEMTDDFIKFHVERPLSALKISLPQTFMHARYVETYELTLGELIAQLGGAIDFWLGITVIGLMHLTVYLIRQCQRCSKPYSKPAQATRLLLAKPSNKENVIKENWYLHTKHRLKNVRRKAEKWKSRFKKHQENVAILKAGGTVYGVSRTAWLRKNRYFETTHMSGWAFISQAKTRTEAVCWYLAMLVFTIFTIRGVEESTAIYMTYPTKTSSEMLLIDTRAAIPNFTFELKTSFFENTKSDERGDKHVSLCSHGLNEFNFGLQKKITVLEVQLQDWLYPDKSDVWNFNPFTDLCPTCDISNNDIDEMVQEMIYLTKQQFTSWDNWHQRVGQWPLSNHFKEEAKVLLSTTLKFTEKSFWSKVSTALLILKVAKEGFTFPENVNTHIFWKQYNVSNELSADILMPTKFHNANLDMLYEAVQQYMANRITLDPVGTMFLTDYNVDTATQLEDHEMQIVLPPLTSDLTLNIYSYSLSGYMHSLRFFMEAAEEKTMGKDGGFNFQGHEFSCILDGLEYSDYENIWDVIDTCYSVFYCEAESSGLVGKYEIFTKIYEQSIAPLLEHYKGRSSMMLNLPGSGKIFLEPFHSYEIELGTAGRYESRIQGCYEGTLEECINLCILNQYKKCGCTPWWLYYIANNKQTVCGKPCESELNQDCEQHCKTTTQHLCSTTVQMISKSGVKQSMYEWNYVTDRPLISTNLPLFSIKFRATRRNIHPRFVERYKMSIASLTSELGGILEFWLGISIMGMIHLVVYTIKQCMKLRDRKTKTGATVRAIFRA